MWDFDESTQYFAYQCQKCYPVGKTDGKAYTAQWDSSKPLSQNNVAAKAIVALDKHMSAAHGTFVRTNQLEYGVKCVCVDCGIERVWSDGIVRKECTITIGRQPQLNPQIFDFILEDWSGYKKVEVLSSNSNIVEVSRGKRRTPIFDDEYMPCYIFTPKGNAEDTATITIKSNGKTVETITLHLINH